MPFNGVGTFTRTQNFGNDKAAGINILASHVDDEFNNLTNGLGNAVTRDGQGQPTANLPMATFRHTGVANGVARTDYAAMGQLEDGTTNWAAAGGGADALAATYIPALTALVDGQLCWVRAAAANATTTPTFAPNGLTARTITKVGGAPVAVGDIAGAGHELVLRYKLSSTIWELLNPALPVVYSNDAGAGAGPSFDIFRDSASPAASDFLGSVDINGRDSAGNKQLYARFLTQITDPTSANEGAQWFIQQVIAGTLTTALRSTPTTIATALIASLTNATNALALAGGTTIQRNGSPTAGDTRYNTTLNVLEYWDGTRWVTNIAPTRQYLLTSGTYTTPVGCRLIIVRMIGGGGGGGAVATNPGTAGGNTIFNSINAAGGSGGAQANGAGGAGGTGGTGSASLRLNGAPGEHGSGGGVGGRGASGFMGAGGGLPGAGVAAGSAAQANSGAGGGGGANGAASNGAGGAAGEYVEIVIAAPAATYAYTIGAKGSGGAAGTQAGGDGGTGLIIVEEYY